MTAHDGTGFLVWASVGLIRIVRPTVSSGANFASFCSSAAPVVTGRHNSISTIAVRQIRYRRCGESRPSSQTARIEPPAINAPCHTKWSKAHVRCTQAGRTAGQIGAIAPGE